jgi:hypothetical protein
LYFRELQHECSELGVSTEAEDGSTRRFLDSLAETLLVIGPSSAALVEAWVAGRKIVSLTADPESRQRYQDSPNVLMMSEDTSDEEMADFMNRRPVTDSAEEERVNHVAAVR